MNPSRSNGSGLINHRWTASGSSMRPVPEWAAGPSIGPCPRLSVSGGMIFNSSRHFLIDTDTGSSLLGLDRDVVRAYYSNVRGAIDVKDAGGYIFPCNAELPEVEIYITNTYRVRVPGNLILGPRLKGGLAQAFGADCKPNPNKIRGRANVRGIQCVKARFKPKSTTYSHSGWCF